MLKCFFEDTAPIGGKDTRALFRGLKIEDARERYLEHQGKYPVIFLSFKDVGKENIDRACMAFKGMISEEFRRHNYVKEKIGDSIDLKKFENLSSGDGELTLELSIPNIELKYIYKTKIQEWFKKRIAGKNLDALHNAVLSGDAETFQSELSALLSESISYMDNAESLYHGVMIGVFARLNGYRLKSNRENGDGRSDLVLYNANENGGKAVIFEFKLAPNAKTLAKACEDALKQIEDKNYAAYWDEEGYKNIVKYGIGFYKKRCEVRKG